MISCGLLFARAVFRKNSKQIGLAYLLCLVVGISNLLLILFFPTHLFAWVLGNIGLMLSQIGFFFIDPYFSSLLVFMIGFCCMLGSFAVKAIITAPFFHPLLLEFNGNTNCIF